jgi:hypothetical protein
MSQEKELYSYVINSSRNYERDSAENSYLQMALGARWYIMMLVNG